MNGMGEATTIGTPCIWEGSWSSTLWGENCFSKSVEALGHWLQAARSEALSLTNETKKTSIWVNRCIFSGFWVTFWEALRLKNRNGSSFWRTTEERPVCPLKWQKEVVPPAKTCEDALHQARLAEKQGWQMSAIQTDRGYGCSSKVSTDMESNSAPSQVTTPTPRVHSKACLLNVAVGATRSANALSVNLLQRPPEEVSNPQN